MREERLPRRHRVAGDRRLGREPLVGGDVLREAEQLGRERRLGERLGARAPDPAGTSTTSSRREPGERRAVARVDDLDVAGVGRERCEQRGGRLAVERASALLEQGRLLVHGGIAYWSSSSRSSAATTAARGSACRSSSTISSWQ